MQKERVSINKSKPIFGVVASSGNDFCTGQTALLTFSAFSVKLLNLKSAFSLSIYLGLLSYKHRVIQILGYTTSWFWEAFS